MNEKKLKLFKWRGVNHLKAKEQGTIIAYDMESACKALFNQGLSQIKISRNWQFNHQPNAQEICDIFKQLASLLNAQLPLKISLQLLHSNCQNLMIYIWLEKIICQLNSGQSLYYALNQEENAQTEFLTSQELQLIKLGEMTGQLNNLCTQIAQHKSQALAMERKIKKIMLYPSIVLLVAIILTILLLIFIVPKFSEIFAQSADALPLFTLILLKISQFLQNYLSVIIAIMGIFFGVIKFIKPIAVVNFLRRWKVKLLSHLPFFRELMKLNQAYNLSHNLALMLGAGVPLTESLNALLHPHNPPIINQALKQCLQGISQGEAFSKAFSQGIFDRSSHALLSIGEKTGQLGKMLSNIASNCEEQLNYRIDVLSQMLEPLLMLIIGGLIALIMLGMYLPIFKLGSMVQ